MSRLKRRAEYDFNMYKNKYASTELLVESAAMEIEAELRNTFVNSLFHCYSLAIGELLYHGIRELHHKFDKVGL